MTIRKLRHDNTIVMSQKHEEQSQSLADVNVIRSMCVSDHVIVQCLRREMRKSGMLSFQCKNNYWKLNHLVDKD